MHAVGDVIGPVHDLRFETDLIDGRILTHPVEKHPVVTVDAVICVTRTAAARGYFDTASNDALVRLSPTLAGASSSITLASSRVSTRNVRVPLESAARCRHLIEGVFAVVPEGWMAQVVRQPGHIDDVRIAAKGFGPVPVPPGPLRGSGSGACAGRPTRRPRTPGSCPPDAEGRSSAGHAPDRGRSRIAALGAHRPWGLRPRTGPARFPRTRAPDPRPGHVGSVARLPPVPCLEPDEPHRFAGHVLRGEQRTVTHRRSVRVGGDPQRVQNG